MYAIIYWTIDDEVYALTGIDGRLSLFESLKEVDERARTLESAHESGVEARVISIEGVKE